VRAKTMPPRKSNRKNHQYSGRVATPVNVKYFLKHVRTAVAKLKVHLQLFRATRRRDRMSFTLSRVPQTLMDRGSLSAATLKWRAPAKKFFQVNVHRLVNVREA
jgi:hypothetical protein